MRIAIAIAIVVLAGGSAAPHGSMLGTGAVRWRAEQAFISDISDGNRPGGHIQLAQQPYSNRCVTPYFTCVLPQPVPVGAACWCATPYGPVAGVVR